MEFVLEQGNKLIVRPSGTEPKIKAYITAVDASKDKSSKLAQTLVEAADEFMK